MYFILILISALLCAMFPEKVNEPARRCGIIIDLTTSDNNHKSAATGLNADSANKILVAVDDKDLKTKLIRHKFKAVMIMFTSYQNSAHGLNSYRSILEDIAADFPMITIIQADTTSCKTTAKRYNVTTQLPTFVFYKNGRKHSIVKVDRHRKVKIHYSRKYESVLG